MFGMLRSLRRWRDGRRPFPAEWIPILEDKVPFYKSFDDDERSRFQTLLKVFVWEKHFIGIDEMRIDDEVRVVISAAAVRLILNLDLSYYDRLTEIIVYEDAFRHPDEDGWTLGEAHSWGTVVLSWQAVLHGLSNVHDGHETAGHEFAHVLDRAGGAFDGTPELHAWEHYRAWAMIMSRHYFALKEGKRRSRKVLRKYGTTNEAEFFAVATEAFFEKSRQMKKHTPKLYEELKRFYRSDPAA